jgi:hypothetical protein
MARSRDTNPGEDGTVYRGAPTIASLFLGAKRRPPCPGDGQRETVPERATSAIGSGRACQPPPGWNEAAAKSVALRRELAQRPDQPEVLDGVSDLGAPSGLEVRQQLEPGVS